MGNVSINVGAYFSTYFTSRHGKEWKYDCLCFNHALVLALEYDAVIEIVVSDYDSEYSYLLDCELCYGKSQLPNDTEKVYRLIREEVHD